MDVMVSQNFTRLSSQLNSLGNWLEECGGKFSSPWSLLSFSPSLSLLLSLAVCLFSSQTLIQVKERVELRSLCPEHYFSHLCPRWAPGLEKTLPASMKGLGMHCYGMPLKCFLLLQTWDTLDNVLMNYKTLPALPAYALKIFPTSWDAFKMGLCSLKFRIKTCSGNTLSI